MRRRVGVAVGVLVGVGVAVAAWIHDAPPSPSKPETARSTDVAGERRQDAPPTAFPSDSKRAVPSGGDVSDEDHLALAAAPEPPEPAADAADDMLVAVREAIADRGASSSDVLMRALDSDDPVAKLEAIDELARRKHVAALAPLMKVDPSDDPFVGPTALLALGRLGHEAGDAKADAAVARLAQLLAAEKERQGTDSPGNILLIFEALGLTKVASGARLLERELLAPEHGTAAKVAIVDALEVCGQRSSTQALVAFRDALRVGADDDFERQLEMDLVAALERVLATLGR